MRTRLLSSVLVVTAALCAGGCDPGTVKPDAGNQGVNVTCAQDAGTLTLTEMHPQVIGTICHECHKPGGTMPDMATVDAMYTNVVDKPSIRYGEMGLKIIDPGNLGNSVLWLKVNGGSPRVTGPRGEFVGGSMPNGLPQLPDEKKALIKQWICSGAPK
ncbi:MAG TPA: hypothetical protein VK447_18895 [Myxococcaceae bacterium]|nr:hypothetical protein [Myxococcaceae bacterium]